MTHTGTLGPLRWNAVSEERYYEMLGVLPPEYRSGNGFLVGEPSDHRRCEISGDIKPRFAAFTHDNEENFFEAERPLTIAEFKASGMVRS